MNIWFKLLIALILLKIPSLFSIPMYLQLAEDSDKPHTRAGLKKKRFYIVLYLSAVLLSVILAFVLFASEQGTSRYLWIALTCFGCIANAWMELRFLYRKEKSSDKSD